MNNKQQIYIALGVLILILGVVITIANHYHLVLS